MNTNKGLADLRAQLDQAHEELTQARLFAIRASQAYQELFIAKEHAHSLVDLAYQKYEQVQMRYCETVANNMQS